MTTNTTAPNALACILHSSFPKTLDQLFQMMDSPDDDDWDTNMEGILQADSEDDLSWSAKPWLKPDDVVFFYQTGRAQKHSRSLLKLTHQPDFEAVLIKALETYRVRAHNPAKFADEIRVKVELVSLLNRAVKLADKYVYTVFACALVKDEPYYARHDLTYFRSRDFVELTNVHIFPRPLKLTGEVNIERGSATSIFGSLANAFKRNLAELNELPPYLAAADFQRVGLGQITAENWREIACDPATRYINEKQFRDNCLDYLLDELKDAGSKVYRECYCDKPGPKPVTKKGSRDGIVDNFIMIGGRWLPVEAKINILVERDLVTQLEQYVRIAGFRASQQPKMPLDRSGTLCLVADIYGLYLYDETDPNWRVPLFDMEAIRTTPISLHSNSII